MTKSIKGTPAGEADPQSGSPSGAGRDGSIDPLPEGESATRPGPCIEFLRLRKSDCEYCSLRHSTLFQNASRGDMHRLTSGIRNGVLRPGAIVYSAGDASPSVFTIRVGMVKLIQKRPCGADRIVRLLGRGATLGLEALGGCPYLHTAVALRTTNLCEIPVQTVDELNAHNPHFMRGMMNKWQEHMQAADIAITLLCSGPVERRILVLIQLISEVGCDSLEAIQLPSVTDISAIVGVSPEAVSRHMAELKRAGLITHVSPRTYRCDPALFGGDAAVELARPEHGPGKK
jgi:CRP/FNR family transcriptional regulator, anaerobic regulatory protein